MGACTAGEPRACCDEIHSELDPLPPGSSGRRLHGFCTASDCNRPVKAALFIPRFRLHCCLSDGWERDWTEQDLPNDFHDVLSLMGQALHDTVQTPTIAENLDWLPEQLLERVRRLNASAPVGE
jgi:hypothetical protein